MRRAPREQAVFGRYLLLQQIAQGGMAQIWRARLAGSRDANEVVVKTLLPRLFGQPIFTDLFAAEARITKLLQHEGVARVLDHGAVKGVPFLAMEPVDGWDLATLYRALPAGRRIPVEIALTIGLEMCRAVGYAHGWRDKRGKRRPIVHGDLSPSNLMVRRDGGLTLIDFGVAHMNPRAARARAHLVIGKSGYLAPELLEDSVADTRSDVFSAGVMLHELLVGRHLFVVDNERETLRRVAEEPVAPPSQSNPCVSRALDEIVLRALDRDPSQRFASAIELADALAQLQTPERASRHQVAAFAVPLCTNAPRVEREPPTTPIAPQVPAALVRVSALPMGPAWQMSTGTVNERRRRPNVADVLAARAAAPRRRFVRRGAIVGAFAVAALVAALMMPLPKVPGQGRLKALGGWLSTAPRQWLSQAKGEWRPLATLEAMVTLQIAPSSAVDPSSPPLAPLTSPSPSPSIPSPATSPPPTAARALPPPASRASSAVGVRHHGSRHSRSARLGRTVATGWLVDPFHSR